MVGYELCEWGEGSIEENVGDLQGVRLRGMHDIKNIRI